MTKPKREKPSHKGKAVASPRELPQVPSAPPNEPARQATSPDADPLAQWRAAREMEEEMNDVFDEDRVTHRHGGTEPEAD